MFETASLLNENACKSAKIVLPSRPPKIYMLSPYTTAVCPALGSGGWPLTDTFDQVPETKQRIGTNYFLCASGDPQITNPASI